MNPATPDHWLSLWKNLTDGKMVEILPVGRNLDLEISISFLAERLLPGSESIRVKLIDVVQFELEVFGEEPESKPEKIAGMGLEIVSFPSIESGSLRVQVDITEGELSELPVSGTLKVQAAGFEIRTEDDRILPLDRLEETVYYYWHDILRNRKDMGK